MPFDIPKGYTSKDVIDRRNGQKQTLGDKARDVSIAVRDDFNESTNKKTPKKESDIPSYKKGGKVRKTGLALLHKGERVIPKHKVKRVEKAMRKYKR